MAEACLACTVEELPRHLESFGVHRFPVATHNEQRDGFRWVRSIAFDPGNEWFATGSADRTIKIWETATGTLKLTLMGHIEQVHHLNDSPPQYASVCLYTGHWTGHQCTASLHVFVWIGQESDVLGLGSQQSVCERSSFWQSMQRGVFP